MILAEGGLRTKGNLKKSNNINPLVSIVTVVLNGEKYLESTIQSIVGQSYENMEYIIVDGGSSDKTINIIKKYENKIDYWVSEQDKGISDAFNKGVKYAKGDYKLGVLLRLSRGKVLELKEYDIARKLLRQAIKEGYILSD